MVRTFRAASKSTPPTYHGWAMPNAVSNSLFRTCPLPLQPTCVQHCKAVVGHQGRFAPLARWPMAILDRRPPPCDEVSRSGRRDGLFGRTKGCMTSALTPAKPPHPDPPGFQKRPFIPRRTLSSIGTHSLIELGLLDSDAFGGRTDVAPGGVVHINALLRALGGIPLFRLARRKDFVEAGAGSSRLHVR